MILVKIHKSQDKEIISLCDKDLIGKTLQDGEIHLEVSESFYKGDEIKDEKELLDLLEKCPNINILGKESVEFAIKNNIIEKSNIIKIKGVPYAIKVAL
ncbi:hypothetical protein CL617_04140 [archaeon]|nr:hypothetical protein [archaeon]|tara:strand:- start:12001 stop:12297 length:297 start_codon:yes stop_codon:yes gene_type:complete